MHCDDVRERIDDLWEGEQSAEVRRHLVQCEACKAYHSDLHLVRGGFRLLKSEEIPEPSLGFAERLVRQLGEISKPPNIADFFERVGRRFVYATMALTCLSLLALALPSTGPVRGLSSADVQLPVVEASLAYSESMDESSLLEPTDSAPVELPRQPVTNEAK